MADTFTEFQADNNVEGGNDNPGLAVQDLSKFDIETLSPETPEIISRQATINIGTIGHVAHGKSTIVKAISKVKTQKHSDEKKQNKTIRLGYANAKIYRIENVDPPACYKSFGSDHPDECIDEVTGNKMKLVRHVSFIDCPGHDTLMSTMLNGASIMDSALLLIAANEKFPQPQTVEHIRAVHIMDLQAMLILQNKIDLVSEKEAKDQREEIVRNQNSRYPILPVSAQREYNIDVILEYITHIPVPKRQLKCPALFVVARSFDINVCGDICNLKGGVAGGSLIKGVFKIGQEIEIRPGQVIRDFENSKKFICRPYKTVIRTLKAENNFLQYAIPGGLISVGTCLDPSITRSDNLVGQLIGDVDSLPPCFGLIIIDYTLQSIVSEDGKAANAKPLKQGELLKVNIGTGAIDATVDRVVNVGIKRHAYVVLEEPVCCEMSKKTTICRYDKSVYRLIGSGTIIGGTEVELDKIYCE